MRAKVCKCVWMLGNQVVKSKILIIKRVKGTSIYFSAGKKIIMNCNVFEYLINMVIKARFVLKGFVIGCLKCTNNRIISV